MCKIAVAFVIVALATMCVARPQESYSDKFDNVNYKDIVKNERLLNNHFECIVRDLKCTAAARELKDHIPEALETDCVKCTATQKEATNFMFEYLSTKKPELWKQLLEVYDKEGKYQAKYEARYKEKGVVAV